MKWIRVVFIFLAVNLVAGSPRPARAVLDVENRGPVLDAGAFAMRITNIGVLGNPFQSIGRSFDPSLEFPRGSGHELLNDAELWVGARDSRGVPRVSGGPLLEWRPTLDPDDRVRVAYAGRPGSRRNFDDDGDGKLDEESLNGRDDDGDGEVDEDLGLPGTQGLSARFTDDQPEAIDYVYPNGESHVPLHLEVQQDAFTWAVPGFDRVAGIHYRITNRGGSELTEVRIGLLADLDARASGSVGGHLDDVASSRDYNVTFFDGQSLVPSVLETHPLSDPTPFLRNCFVTERGRCAVVEDSRRSSGVASVALVPMSHTTDPLGMLVRLGRLPESIARPFLVSPTSLTFRSQWFAKDVGQGQGGLPVLDADRMQALRGEYPTLADTLRPHDLVLLVSCGPFAKLAPGASVEVDLAFVVGAADSLQSAIEHAVQVYRGGWVNSLPDTSLELWRHWSTGKSGITGHETCYEPPVGLEFEMDPHCMTKYIPSLLPPLETSVQYNHGYCVWTDMDCDACTGFDGRETQVRWRDPAGSPPPPEWRVLPGDRRVTVEWGSESEVMFAGFPGTPPNMRFVGYNLYRLDDWVGRKSDLPDVRRFQQVASFGVDTSLGARPIAEVTDSTVDYSRVLYERRVFPIGRYRWTDTRVLDGFDYVYAVTAVAERTLQVLNGVPITERVESPIVARLDSVVTPHTSAQPLSGTVHVVPNPYRGSAAWERPIVPGDVFTKHLDFVALPRARCTIRIYTLAGDLVQSLEHDGRHGDGQARWDLISRNGQDVASGIYLFTVDSPLGHQVGRFVVMR